MLRISTMRVTSIASYLQSLLSSLPKPTKGICIAMMTFAFCSTVYAQDTKPASPFSISGYLETYYIYDFGNPQDHKRPDFVYSFNRHNEVNLNLGYIQASYLTDQVRANLALMTGTYANANLAAEPGVLKNIYEASIGVKISKNHNLWIDAGIFPSHVGFESAVGAVCWNMTRSMLADNSPYFESGAKLSYTSEDERWFFSGLILNGWQRIQRLDGNNTPAFGHQLTFKPSDKIILNSSSFIGSDTPDSLRQMRYFHNLYGQFEITERVGLIAGFDIGVQQRSKESKVYDSWYSPVVIARYLVSDILTLAARAEYYADPSEVIISTGTANGFKTFGYSLNADLAVAENVLWRIEARSLRSEDRFFEDNGVPSNGNTFLGTSLSVTF
ncbi:porin [Algoriphagus sp. D3-2-R+10]|uniref:porin n=1 Tax=Algoriphagus aurantiacus TaxID=3103948 RepID=UPI002B3CAB82|nr:porin [Algoriphagus sp. D3-2-R+10]MEB2778442.1 porin [Algoriphagus sp. D3-2-R+10]